VEDGNKLVIFIICKSEARISSEGVGVSVFMLARLCILYIDETIIIVVVFFGEEC
jgi:hypothetical protein